MAPPGYGEHMLDQLYEDVDMNGLQSGFQTPAIQSGINTPFYAQSRAGSAENLHAMTGMQAFHPAALSSRLQDVSLDATSRNNSYNSLSGAATTSTDGATTPYTPHPGESTHYSPPTSAALSRSHSGENPSGINTPEHVELEDLSRVPSYTTAVKTPVRPISTMDLPTYNSAVSAPNSPGISTAHIANPMDTIPEARTTNGIGEAVPPRPRPSRRQTSLGFSNLLHHHHSAFEDDVRRRLHLLQSRAQPY